MSIYDELRVRVKEGRLFWVPPPELPGAMLRRQLYISSEIKRLVDGPWKDSEWEERCGYLESDLHRFVLGEMIPVRIPPSKSVDAYMAKLEPSNDETWEIRSRDPLPQLRLFGSFAGKDCFVALTWAYRWYLDNDLEKWNAALAGYKAEWRKLFIVYSPLPGASIHDYISKKFYPV